MPEWNLAPLKRQLTEAFSDITPMQRDAIQELIGGDLAPDQLDQFSRFCQAPSTNRMTTASTYPALTTDETGTTLIRGTRYKVLHLAAEHYQHGWTAEELLRQHPDLQPAQVYSALAFFYENREELLSQLNASLQQETPSTSSSISREALLDRKQSIQR